MSCVNNLPLWHRVTELTVSCCTAVFSYINPAVTGSSHWRQLSQNRCRTHLTEGRSEDIWWTRRGREVRWEKQWTRGGVRGLRGAEEQIVRVVASYVPDRKNAFPTMLNYSFKIRVGSKHVVVEIHLLNVDPHTYVCVFEYSCINLVVVAKSAPIMESTSKWKQKACPQGFKYFA